VLPHSPLFFSHPAGFGQYPPSDTDNYFNVKQKQTMVPQEEDTKHASEKKHGMSTDMILGIAGGTFLGVCVLYLLFILARLIINEHKQLLGRRPMSR
jgi:hypothetical protein